MSTTSLDSVNQSPKPSMSTASIAGLVVIPMAFFLCVLLVFLGTWAQMHRTGSATRHQNPLPVPAKDYHSPATSIGSFECAGARSVATLSRPVQSQCHARPKVADQSAACSPFQIYRGTDMLAAVHLPRVKRYSQMKAIMEPLIDRKNPFPLKCGSAQRFSLDLESAWPQPLQPVWTELKGLLEQQLWRSSSGGSSCYSRPSSWRSVSDTEELAENPGFGVGAGPGPMIRLNQTPARGYKALPAVPTQEEQSCFVDIVATDRI